MRLFSFVFVFLFLFGSVFGQKIPKGPEMPAGPAPATPVVVAEEAPKADDTPVVAYKSINYVSDACNNARWSLYNATLLSDDCAILRADKYRMSTGSLNKLCSSDCYFNVTEKAKTMLTACANYESHMSEQKDQTWTIAQQAAILCTKVDGSFCFPAFQESLRNLKAGEDSKFLQKAQSGQLDKLCSACGRKIWQNAQNYGLGNSAKDEFINKNYESLCAKDGNQYCVNVVGNFMISNGDNGNGGVPSAISKKTKLSDFCSPCFRRLSNIAANSSEVFRVDTDALCKTDGKGGKCATNLVAAVAVAGVMQGTSCLGPIAVVASAGCCGNSFSSIMNLIGEEETARWTLGNITRCDLSFQSECKKPYSVSSKLKLKNLRHTYYSDYQKEIDAGIKEDIAKKFGVLPGDVTVKGEAATSYTPNPKNVKGYKIKSAAETENDSVTIITVTMNADTSSDASALQTGLNNAIVNNDLQLASLNELSNSAKFTPSESIAADTTSTVTLLDQSNAILQKPSAFVFLVAIGMAFFAYRL